MPKAAHLLILLCLFALLFPGCRGGSTKRAPALSSGLPRVSPAYVQWLTRQSMLGQSEDFINQVSGTSRIWQNSGTEERFLHLLASAPTWLEYNPHLEFNLNPAFKNFASPSVLDPLRDMGITGLYLSPTSETAELWAQPPPQVTDGEDVVSFSFHQNAGSEKDFIRFRSLAEADGLQIGGSLPQAATGLGPDFMLQARGLPDFEGLYAAIEIPAEFWHVLPECTDEWQVSELTEKARQSLIEGGILPWALHKDRSDWSNVHGWAVTGVVTGIDGKKRRWGYCYDKDIRRPVLLWQDPSGHARRLYAAACIRHTGLEQQTLAGLSLKALMGLDPLREGESTEDVRSQLEPGLSALAEISQSVHRYGGWTVLTDSLPMSLLPSVLTGADFVRDSITPAAIHHAVQTGDTKRLYDALAKSFRQKIPHRRLAHRIEAGHENGPSLSSSSHKAMGPDQLLELAVQTGLPGLVFLRLEEAELLSGHSSGILSWRNALHLAQGELLPPAPAPKGSILLLSRLPEGGYWLTAVNFSRMPQELKISLPDNRPGYRLSAISAVDCHVMTKNDTTGILSLAPRTFCYAYFGKPTPQNLLGK